VFARSITGLAVYALGFGALYHDVIAGLIRDWATDDNYSHGFFVAPLALYFAWERRRPLLAASIKPNAIGLVAVAASLAVLVAGVLGADLFATRVSMIGVVAGTILFVWGWPRLRLLAFPLSFLVLMIPLPALVLNQVVMPLQLIASQLGESILDLLHIPALREGNVIVLANATLQVAEACSGIRSLISLLTAGIVLGYFVDQRFSIRVLVALTAVPIAIVTNGLRVAGTGVTAHYYGPMAADRFFHGFSGWVVFLLAVLIMCAVQFTISGVVRRASRERPAVPTLST
jgi:exosortase